MTDSRARVRIELENRPENVALVRAGLSSLDDVFDFGDLLLNDLKTAVSEACNNVVVHAYGDDHGPMMVTVECSDTIVEVLVRDQGGGIRQLTASEDRMGLGLAVMSALADRVEFRTPREGGTEVRMCFRRVQESLDDFYTESSDRLKPAPIDLTGDAVLWFEPVTLIQPVLGRILRAIAASSNFSIGSVADLAAVTDALAAYAEYGNDGSAIGVAITGTPRRLELSGGPFPAEAADAPATDRHARWGELERVVDGLSTFEVEGLQTLQLVLLDRAGSR